MYVYILALASTFEMGKLNLLSANVRGLNTDEKREKYPLGFMKVK